MELELPYPPSINHYWRRIGSRTLISRSGRVFRAEVFSILNGQRRPKMLGRLEVEVDLYPPDRRRRDVDNILKPLLDSLQHGGIYVDDSQIDELHIHRRECVPGGCVRVRLRTRETVESTNDVAKLRTCLKCSRWFDSFGPSNRFCSRCRRKNDRLGLGERDLQAQRGLKRHNGEILAELTGCP